jgi:hypothetical protein
MQARGARPPLGVVFDADYGVHLDSLLTLNTLFAFDNKNDCRVVSVSTSLNSIPSAMLLEVTSKIYGARPYPIGMNHGGENKSSPILEAATAGQSSYVKSIIDTAEPHNLIRNALTASFDANSIIVSLGPTNNLVDLLNLPTAKPVIEAKVKALYLAGEDPKPIPNWPTPIATISAAMAKDLRYTPAPTDFPWLENHPLAQALKLTASTINRAGMLAVLHALRPTDFPIPLNATQAAAADKLLAELVPMKPIPRQRFRPPAA